MDKIIVTEHIGLTQPVPGKTDEFWLGIVKIRELPKDITEQEYKEWWPRLSEKERERYTAGEFKNILTTAGRTQLLIYIASSTGIGIPFSAFFSVGTFPVIAVSPGDTSVQTEIFRAVPQTVTITGNQLTLSTLFGQHQANGNYTNAGLYGGTASATLGTGTLYTHTLYTYSKVDGTAISNDYIITLS